MKRFFILLILALVVAGGYWAFEERSDLGRYIDFGQSREPIHTFELAYTPEVIMQRNQKELLRTGEHSFGKAYVQFAPMLLMHVKFAPDAKHTEEADSLWDLSTAEMVLDTNSFETTHGFEDCVNSGASEDDFRILHALSKHGGSENKEQLARELGMDSDVLASRLESLRKKHLIVQKIDTISLHFQTPLLKVVPRTKISHSIVDKQISKDGQIRSKYSKSQIQKVAQDAFGSDFAIRSAREVFLPIVVIVVQNPDGSQLKSFFNGVTGKKVILLP